MCDKNKRNILNLQHPVTSSLPYYIRTPESIIMELCYIYDPWVHLWEVVKTKPIQTQWFNIALLSGGRQH